MILEFSPGIALKALFRKPTSVLEIGTWFHFWVRGSKSKADKLVTCLRFKGLRDEELSHDFQKISSESEGDDLFPPTSNDVGGSSSLAGTLAGTLSRPGRIFNRKKKTEVDSRRSSVDSSQSSSVDGSLDSGLYNWLKDLFSIFLKCINQSPTETISNIRLNLKQSKIKLVQSPLENDKCCLRLFINGMKVYVSKDYAPTDWKELGDEGFIRACADEGRVLNGIIQNIEFTTSQ